MSAPHNTPPISKKFPHPQNTNDISLEALFKKQKEQATNRNMNRTKNPTNDADKGKIFERLVVVLTFLTLKDGEKMVYEMKEAGNFDDVAV